MASEKHKNGRANRYYSGLGESRSPWKVWVIFLPRKRRFENAGECIRLITSLFDFEHQVFPITGMMIGIALLK